MAKDASSPTEPCESAPSALIGIGSAAGGMEAMEQLVEALPSDFGAAFIVVQHVDTDGSDVLTEVISRFTSLTVQTLSETAINPERGTIYVAPQRCSVERSHDGFVAVQQNDASQRGAVIDGLFQALVDFEAAPIVGIVLSGAGADGTLGLKAISDAGGMTIAQDPETARQDEMPRNAGLAGNADHVLSPKDIAAELTEYVRHLRTLRHSEGDEAIADDVEAVLPRICDVLLEVTEYDFRHYKSKTLVRRVARRMQVLRARNADDYLNRLQEDREETHALLRELLVSVTCFFRDPDTFATLAGHVVPKLFEQRDEVQPIRIWVPGCATGQEAYTLAMLMQEELDKHIDAKDSSDIDIQIFATDIDRRALNVARAGAYPLSIANEVTEHRLERFFAKTGNTYTVTKRIRDMCVFSVHNLISDSPFSQMDLISCRNLLIYLGQPLQVKLIPLFHFALKPNGYLLLGPSENLTEHTEIFRPIDKKHRISQRKPGPVRSRELLSGRERLSSRSTPATVGSPNESDIHRISQQIVLDEFAPRFAVINEESHLVCSSTGLERYFEFPGGPFMNNVIKMAKPGLRNGLRTAVRASRESLRTTVRDDLSLQSSDGTHRIRLVVQPMPEIGQDTNLFMLVFHDMGNMYERMSLDDEDDRTPEVETTIEQLETELDRTRTDLEGAVQDLESSNEELKSSNEELRSLNEELQSANEELETSKEEIQAGMEALSRARGDLENLLNGTKIATVFLDQDGNINSFTPTATEIYNVKEGDVGRPLSDITHKAEEMPRLPEMSEVAAAKQYIEDEIHTEESRWFLRRVLPYLHEGQPAGMILTFVDVSDKKRSEMRLAAKNAVTQLLATAESFNAAIPKLLENLRANLNAKYCSLWLVDSESETLYCSEASVAPDSPELETFVERSQGERFKQGEGLPGRVWKSRQPDWIEDAAGDVRFSRHEEAKQGGLTSGMATPILTGKRFRGVIEFFTDRSLDREQSLLDMLRDVGHEIGQFIRRTRLDDKFRDEEARKTAILEAALDCIITVDVHGRIVDFNAVAESTFGIDRAEAVGKLFVDMIVPDEFKDSCRNGLVRFLQTGESEILGKRVEVVGQRADGSRFPVEMAISLSDQRNGSPFFTGYLRDITDRKRQELELADREAHLRRVIDNMLGMVGVLDIDGTLLEANQTAIDAGGVSRDELIGKKFWDCYWWSFDSSTQEQLQEAIKRAAAGGTVRYDVTVRMSGDTRMIIDFMLVPVLDAEGNVTHLIPSGVDIDETQESRTQAGRRQGTYGLSDGGESRRGHGDGTSRRMKSSRTTI